MRTYGRYFVLLIVIVCGFVGFYFFTMATLPASANSRELGRAISYNACLSLMAFFILSFVLPRIRSWSKVGRLALLATILFSCSFSKFVKKRSQLVKGYNTAQFVEITQAITKVGLEQKQRLEEAFATFNVEEILEPRNLQDQSFLSVSLERLDAFEKVIKQEKKNTAIQLETIRDQVLSAREPGSSQAMTEFFAGFEQGIAEGASFQQEFYAIWEQFIEEFRSMLSMLSSIPDEYWEEEGLLFFLNDHHLEEMERYFERLDQLIEKEVQLHATREEKYSQVL